MKSPLHFSIYLVNANFDLITMYILRQQQHPFNGPLFGTTWVSQYQKGKTNLDLVEQERVAVASAGPSANLHLAPDR